MCPLPDVSSASTCDFGSATTLAASKCSSRFELAGRLDPCVRPSWRFGPRRCSAFYIKRSLDNQATNKQSQLGLVPLKKRLGLVEERFGPVACHRLPRLGKEPRLC